MGFGLELGTFLFSFKNKNKNSAMMVWKGSFNDITFFIIVDVTFYD